MDVRDKVAELYPFNGSDPGMVIALRSAFRAGVEWYAEGIDDGTATIPDQHEQEQ